MTTTPTSIKIECTQDVVMLSRPCYPGAICSRGTTYHAWRASDIGGWILLLVNDQGDTEWMLKHGLNDSWFLNHFRLPPGWDIKKLESLSLRRGSKVQTLDTPEQAYNRAMGIL